MESHLHRLKETYHLLFNELSKLQVEEKFLERKAQQLISHIMSQPMSQASREETEASIQAIIEEHDIDFILQKEHLDNLKEQGIIDSAETSIAKLFGSDPKAYAYDISAFK
jgi:predicted ArsR family transcriptional regulator